MASATETPTVQKTKHLNIEHQGVIVNDSRYWAILICGSDDFNAGFETDIRDMYQLLTTNLGYNPDYIYYVAPSNWNSASHYYGLSKSNIQTAIEAVANRTTPEDNVFVFYNGHGTHDPWTIAPNVSPVELDSWLDTIDPGFLFLPRHCQQMVVLLQSCYCGGFTHSLTYHEAYPSGIYHRYRLVITSTNETTASWEDMNGYGDPAWDPNGPDDDGNPSNPSNGNWDGSEFASGFRMSFRDVDSDNLLEADDNPYMKKPGYNPDITAPFGNKNGKVSVREAFNFSKYAECYSVYWQSYCQVHSFLLEYPKLWDPITAGDPQGINPSATYIYTRAPAKPGTPVGQTKGKPGESYTYTSNTTDPDGDQVSYWFDWGDGTNSGWTGPYASGVTASASHTWNVKGQYQIKVKAKDVHGVESVWSDLLPVQMPISLGMTGFHLLEHLFERFPHLLPLLRHLLGY
jgi:hypothetical protein